MARIRTVKPALARHRGLFDLEQELGINVRFAWAMLPGSCDREGRFLWRPWDLKLDVLPYDNVDLSRVLDAWLTRGYLVKYRVGKNWFGWLPTFKCHQTVNNREKDSDLPGVDEAEEVIDHRNQEHADASTTRDARVTDNAQAPSSTRLDPAPVEGKGREQEGKGTVRSTRQARVVHASPIYPDGLSVEAWNTWEQYRASGKHPLKPESLPAAMQAMADLGDADTQMRAVKHSMANGYRGLFLPDRDKFGGARVSVLPTKSPDELEAEALARGEDVWTLQQ